MINSAITIFIDRNLMASHASCSSLEALESEENYEMILTNFSGNPKDVQSADISFKGKVSQITHGIGMYFPNLKKLEVNSGHNFISVEKIDFESLNQLKELSLLFNHIDILATNAFDDLTNLEILNLASCDLKRLPEKVFSNLSKLKELYLRSNLLRSIHENIFHNLEALETLDLSDNRIEALPSKLLASNLQLKFLELSHGKIKLIQVDFTALKQLEKVDLEGNVCISSYFNKAYVELNAIGSLTELQNIVSLNCTKQ